jgi:hypothetical protein
MTSGDTNRLQTPQWAAFLFWSTRIFPSEKFSQTCFISLSLTVWIAKAILFLFGQPELIAGRKK